MCFSCIFLLKLFLYLFIYLSFFRDAAVNWLPEIFYLLVCLFNLICADTLDTLSFIYVICDATSAALFSVLYFIYYRTYIY